jgi:opacity protein-like surface antigen
LRRHTLIGCLACILSLTTLSLGQATPTASRAGSIQLGIGAMFTSPDYGQKYIKGLTFYGDFDFAQHLGVEADIHYAINTPQNESENTYLLGPRYTFRKKHFGVYAKGLLGLGQFGYQSGSFPNPYSSTYFVYAFGGGVEYAPTRHINIRGFDVEFQKWPGFPPNGLSPITYTIGAAYVFH